MTDDEELALSLEVAARFESRLPGLTEAMRLTADTGDENILTDFLAAANAAGKQKAVIDLDRALKAARKSHREKALRRNQKAKGR